MSAGLIKVAVRSRSDGAFPPEDVGADGDGEPETTGDEDDDEPPPVDEELGFPPPDELQAAAASTPIAARPVTP
jgi:hypothetical protein